MGVKIDLGIDKRSGKFLSTVRGVPLREQMSKVFSLVVSKIQGGDIVESKLCYRIPELGGSRESRLGNAKLISLVVGRKCGAVMLNKIREQEVELILQFQPLNSMTFCRATLGD